MLRSSGTVRSIAFSALTLAAAAVFPQPPMATVEGQVVEAASGRPVPDAVVVLLPGNTSLMATTDTAGRFRMAAVPVGLYALRAAAMGFDTLEVPELWLRAGKQTVQRLELSPAANLLGAVRISALARERPGILGVHNFTVEQSLRWAATFFDPARLVTALPGVASVNDQANHLVIRGNSPNANAWTLQGVEIVNPSHTGNAGTASDLPTLSGGGVNILSAQMLGTSQLLMGVLPADRDNALGGVLDMHLRNGNMKQQEWTLQAGLLGIDASTEGPLGKGGRSSYLANYRYSTVGLLGAMGVDLGDEAITFQDFSFHVALPVGKRGEMHLFGLGGNSSNVFEALHDTTEWEVDKDSRNIDYRSSMGAVGANMRVAIGDRTTLSAALAVSEIDQERTESLLLPDFSVGSHFEAALSERKLSGMAQVEGAIGARFRYSAGASATERRLTSWQNSDVHGWLLRPWIHGRWSLTEHLQATAGVGVAYFTFTEEAAAEPRASLEWRMRRGRKLALAAGLRSQLPQWQSFGVGTWPLLTQQAIGLTHSQDLVLGYDHPIMDHLTVHAEAYYQYLTDVPVLSASMPFNAAQAFSMVNVWDEGVGIPLQPTGTATNMGAELSMDRRFADDFFWQVNGTVFNSRYTDVTGAEHATRWNSQYLLNLFGGKEFKKVKEDRVRTWGVSGRANVMGGLRETPIDVRASRTAGSTVFGGPAWSGQLPTCYRIDLRVYLKKDHKGRTGMWSVDLQNVTDAQNAAFRHYDHRKGEVITRYQLGIIPNLSYRIEF
ncbi:MAG: carboxypeptidase regulatory-like domain-containing protein [Flavobacteriales bacterium]|nr:carboxypeptidase regulatory-like domain-containing protein [Flavobacteriales bacterium]MBP9080759.1 carboxypeptidase regulatory-like domain-containing protein [Flavobacteriales bacterium]